MCRFKSVEHAQRFLEPFGRIREHFCPSRQRLSGNDHRATLITRFAIWSDATGAA